MGPRRGSGGEDGGRSEGLAGAVMEVASPAAAIPGSAIRLNSKTSQRGERRSDAVDNNRMCADQVLRSRAAGRDYSSGLQTDGRRGDGADDGSIREEESSEGNPNPRDQQRSGIPSGVNDLLRADILPPLASFVLSAGASGLSGMQAIRRAFPAESASVMDSTVPRTVTLYCQLGDKQELLEPHRLELRLDLGSSSLRLGPAGGVMRALGLRGADKLRVSIVRSGRAVVAAAEPTAGGWGWTVELGTRDLQLAAIPIPLVVAEALVGERTAWQATQVFPVLLDPRAEKPPGSGPRNGTFRGMAGNADRKPEWRVVGLADWLHQRGAAPGDLLQVFALRMPVEVVVALEWAPCGGLDGNKGQETPQHQQKYWHLRTTDASGGLITIVYFRWRRADDVQEGREECNQLSAGWDDLPASASPAAAVPGPPPGRSSLAAVEAVAPHAPHRGEGPAEVSREPSSRSHLTSITDNDRDGVMTEAMESGGPDVAEAVVRPPGTEASRGISRISKNPSTAMLVEAAAGRQQQLLLQEAEETEEEPLQRRGQAGEQKPSQHGLRRGSKPKPWPPGARQGQAQPQQLEAQQQAPSQPQSWQLHMWPPQRQQQQQGCTLPLQAGAVAAREVTPVMGIPGMPFGAISSLALPLQLPLAMMALMQAAQQRQLQSHVATAAAAAAGAAAAGAPSAAQTAGGALVRGTPCESRSGGGSQADLRVQGIAVMPVTVALGTIAAAVANGLALAPAARVAGANAGGGTAAQAQTRGVHHGFAVVGNGPQVPPSRGASQLPQQEVLLMGKGPQSPMDMLPGSVSTGAATSAAGFPSGSCPGGLEAVMRMAASEHNPGAAGQTATTSGVVKPQVGMAEPGYSNGFTMLPLLTDAVKNDTRPHQQQQQQQQQQHRQQQQQQQEQKEHVDERADEHGLAPHLPSPSALRYLHGCVPTKLGLPPLQPGEVRLYGVTFSACLNVGQLLAKWQAAQQHTELSGWRQITIDLPHDGANAGASDGHGGGDRGGMSAGPSGHVLPQPQPQPQPLWVAAFRGPGALLPRPVCFDLTRKLGLTTNCMTPLPEGPVEPQGLEVRRLPERPTEAGLFASRSFPRNCVICVMGCYVKAQETGLDPFVEKGYEALEGPVKQQLQLRMAAGCGRVSEAMVWRFLAMSFRMAFPGHEGGRAGCPGLPALELQMLSYGGLAACVNDPWVRGPDATQPHTRKEANCVVVPVMVRGVPLPVLVALHDIKPGEELLREYGNEWWRRQSECLGTLEDHGASPGAVLHDPNIIDALPMGDSAAGADRALQRRVDATAAATTSGLSPPSLPSGCAQAGADGQNRDPNSGVDCGRDRQQREADDRGEEKQEEE
ncbi:hypothetical protein VaNZ11_015759, partial [Volvox africanus]